MEISIYLASLAIIVIIEHRLFSRRWRDFELARRTLGIATVLLLCLPLAVAGTLDLLTWLVIFSAFGLSGAITGALYTMDSAREKERRVKSLRAVIHNIGGQNGTKERADSRRGTPSS